MFVITGGGSGIGRALALKLAQRGKKVLIIGRNVTNLEGVSVQNPNIKYFCADVSNQEDRLSIKQHIKETKIKALINNAGIIQPIAKITDITFPEWQQVMATNLDAPLFLTKLLITNLVGGRVLNIGSGAAHFPIFAWAPYCVSKAALFRLTECFQLEEDNIAFASVKPGIIDTDMQKEIRESTKMDDSKHDFFQKLFDEKKLISTEVVANFLSWLLLDIDVDKYKSKEWDIYDKEHQKYWLDGLQKVPDFHE